MSVLTKSVTFNSLGRFIPITYYFQRNASSLGKTMGKFYNASNKKKKFYNQGETMLKSPQNVLEKKNEHARISNRRLNVLHKLFMTHITDQMASGTISEALEGKELEITKIKITDDFKLLNIYWITKKLEDEATMEKFLKDIAFHLRHELTQLKVMGVVPIINFVKDKNILHLLNIDTALVKADYGDEYVPNNYIELMKSESTLEKILNPKILEKIIDLDKNDSTTHTESDLPPMSHNVFGLDRNKIMSNILKHKQISKDAWNKKIDELNNQQDTLQSAEFNISTIDSINSQMADRSLRKIEFDEFLKKRTIMQRKMIQRLKKDKEEALRITNELDDYEDNYSNEEEIDQDFEEHLQLFEDDHCDYDYDDNHIEK